MNRSNSLELAKNPEKPPEILADLSKSKNHAIRQAVASNPNTPTEVLFKLGAEFPKELLENPVFDLLILEKPNLLEDLSEDTLIALLKLERVPDYFLEWAASQQYVTRLIEDNSEGELDPIEILAEDEKVRCESQKYPPIFSKRWQ